MELRCRGGTDSGHLEEMRGRRPPGIPKASMRAPSDLAAGLTAPCFGFVDAAEASKSLRGEEVRLYTRSSAR